MRAIMVAVDYCDLLAITLPYNRHHFDDVMVVTSNADFPNILPIAETNRASVFATDSFYADGARFNKWRALEEGLDEFKREGWLCLMDADVLWPKSLNERKWMEEKGCLTPGFLYSPLRRMCDPIPRTLPQEKDWAGYPVHRNVNEWAGYSQVFHASDPVLGPAPWHDIHWRHAGGADSFFQAKWPRERKIRPQFEVLHLGPAGVNWGGRASEYVGGGRPLASGDRKNYVASIWTTRNERRRRGLDPFAPEKLP